MTVTQPASFEYSPANLTILATYLSSERLAAYYAMAKKDLKKAVWLYERNTELSEALYGVVQGFEVTLRNAVHNAISKAHGEAWYEAASLFEDELNAIAKAK